jgi:hypothetical protein
MSIKYADQHALPTVQCVDLTWANADSYSAVLTLEDKIIVGLRYPAITNTTIEFVGGYSSDLAAASTNTIKDAAGADIEVTLQAAGGDSYFEPGSVPWRPYLRLRGPSPQSGSITLQVYLMSVSSPKRP